MAINSASLVLDCRKFSASSVRGIKGNSLVAFNGRLVSTLCCLKFQNFYNFSLKFGQKIYLKSEVYKKKKNSSVVIMQWNSDSHGEVRHKGVGRETELEEAVSAGHVSVDHHAGHSGEGVAGDDGGLDGELLDVRLVLLQGAAGAKEFQ